MKLAYQSHTFHGSSRELIVHADEIMTEYAADGYDLTLRQLYYQFVARNLLPNTEKNYKRLGEIVSQARLAGLLDWDVMVDRTRELRRVSHWDSPADIVGTCARQFRIDTRTDQANYIEVWVEKEALAGIVLPICAELDVHCLVCRGFISQSAMWEGASRFHAQAKADKTGILLHLGDHDPSGLDMTRDIRDRLNDTFGAPVSVERIALTMPQVEEIQPPPNPAKVTDSRYDAYVSEYGPTCWEMDAIDPRRLTQIIQMAVKAATNAKKRNKLIAKQDSHREQLQTIADRLDADPGWIPEVGE